MSVGIRGGGGGGDQRGSLVKVVGVSSECNRRCRPTCRYTIRCRPTCRYTVSVTEGVDPPVGTE